MTNLQQFMLSVCFGAVVGVLIGNLIFIISFTVDKIKEKRRNRAKAKESDAKTE